jgi:hypothetical protein
MAEPEPDRSVSGTDPDPYQNVTDPQQGRFRGTGTYLERSQVVHSHPSGGSSGTVMPAEACKPTFHKYQVYFAASIDTEV